MKESEIKEMLGKADLYKQFREDEEPDYYPKRYVSLVTQALRSGEISVSKYLDYLKHDRPTRKQAEEITSSHVPDPIEVPASHI